jgi:hypothetical protein
MVFVKSISFLLHFQLGKQGLYVHLKVQNCMEDLCDQVSHTVWLGFVSRDVPWFLTICS